jgi:cyclohexyl-isocyanide hydratase
MTTPWLRYRYAVRAANGEAPSASDERERDAHVLVTRDRLLDHVHHARSNASIAELEVLQVDPRRCADAPLAGRAALDAKVTVPRDAIRRVVPAASVLASKTGDADAQLEALGLADAVRGTQIAFVAFEGMTLLDLVGAHDPLSRIRSMGFDATSGCAIVSATDARVWAQDGARVEVVACRPPLEAFDVVVVAGGPGARAVAEDEDVVAWLRRYPADRMMASVCTGALLLGAAGRLAGRRATTHASALDRLEAYGATAARARVVDEGAVVTAGGVTSGIDLGLHLVTRLCGADVAAAIARQMEVATTSP